MGLAMKNAKSQLIQTILACLLAGSFASSAVFGATVTVVNVNDPGEGFNDPTPVAPVTGNPGETLGEQRLNAFQAAADEWAAMLVSDVEIVVQAQMNPDLFCDATSAVLGSAGPTTAYRNFPNAPVANTWYPPALANSLAGFDLSASLADLSANFNPDIGTDGCLEFSSGWSYEIGNGVPAAGLSFYNTVIHEIGHGVGFLTFANGSTGALANGFPDHYAQFLYSEADDNRWPALDDAERASSAVSVAGLTWDGPEVANVDQLLSTGVNASGRVQMYAPNPFRGGSSVSHFDISLDPNDIMEPNLTAVNQKRLTNHLMLDIGWITMLQLDVGISDGVPTLPAGAANSYTITLDNSGPADLTIVDAVVTNTQPAGFEGATWTCNGADGATCASASGSGDISENVTIPTGGQITFTVSGTISGGFAGELVNTVSVDLPDNIQNTVLSTDSDSTTVVSGPGITVTPISSTTSEAGDTASFSVVLNTEPAADVTIPLSSTDTGEGMVQASVQFTGGDWSTPRVVEVTGVNDNVNDGDQPYTIVTGVAQSADGDYDGLNPADVGMINLDDDTAGISVSAISGTTSESGDPATFTIVLNSEPVATVTVNLSSSDTQEGTVDPSSFDFDAGNWNVPREITVTGVDDAVDDGDQAFDVLIGSVSADGNYNGLSDSIAVTNVDDDTAGISVSDISGDTSESGDSASFTIVLDSQPTADVTIGLSSTNVDEGTVSNANLTFTAVDWNTPHLVTVSGVDDQVVDGDVAYEITISPASSSDPLYDGIDPDDLMLLNIDDDLPPEVFKDGFEG